MSKLDYALALARDGFYVFPIAAGAKKPPLVPFKNQATRDLRQISAWWADGTENNIGIYTGRYGDTQALLVVDVDNKGTKRGNHELVRLELEGFDLPPTRETATPTGGRHLFFSVASPARQGANVLGPGLDVRSRGGYVVAPGSDLGPGKLYIAGVRADVAPAPAWLEAKCRAPLRNRHEQASAPPVQVSQDRAQNRARRYLETEAPPSVKGDGGDSTAYAVACRIKDFGVDEATCLDLMLGSWNERSPPGWTADKLAIKVHNAYHYGTEPPGVAAPETVFEPVKDPQAAAHPFEELNKEFSFVLAGGGSHILWETTDAHGRWKLEHLAPSAFHGKYASYKIMIGKKENPVTQEWMAWKGRRSYDGLVFMPEQPAPARFYNLWRGFSCEPWPDDVPPTKDAEAALHDFLEHAHDNVCQGHDELYRYLMGYFAHLVQKPWEKPLVALVFRGGKGVGKNALVERIGDLLGGHFLVTSNRRYLTGNFNGHLENCLLFALDEAFWSGDKAAEGIVKDLVTGKQHVIEHKGKEPYTVDNRTRVAIIGNEDWLVPASHDERRFAVFDVGSGRKQDRDFFQHMRERMERGGNRLLLRHLRQFDLVGLDINAAPNTKALLEQKMESLDIVHQWWHESLTEGRLAHSDFADSWPTERVECGRLHAAFHRYARERHIKGRLPDGARISAKIRKCCFGFVHNVNRGPNTYTIPDLEAARKEWTRFTGHEVDWETA